MKVADKEEMLKVLDEFGNYTGKMEKRSIIHNNELFHNEVALWIVDKENKKILLERRSPNKKIFPNRLGLCAGHIVEDETVEEALKKEAYEEIGINIDDYDVKKLMLIKRQDKNNYCFSHQFYIDSYIPIDKFNIQLEELTEVLYIDYEKLKKMAKNNDERVVFKWIYYKDIFAKLDKIIGVK